MPILPREPDIYPESLLTGDVACEPATAWWAIYTLPRKEKELMRRLRRMEIAFYAPLVRRRNRSADGRVRVSHVPLFPGYVFLHGTDEHRYSTFKTNCVARCLKVPDSAELVHDLRQVYQLISSDAPLTPEARIQPGTRVRVRSGPLMGLEGTVVRRRGAERLLVVVHFLQQGASVQLDDCQVEQIDA